MAYIYQIINDINDKVYVGKTQHSIEKRFKEHCSDAFKDRCQNRPLYRAMRKYGIEHFSIELLEETENPEEREIYWIEAKGSFKNGYNATIGGDGKSYLDYDLIIATYLEVQNISETASILEVSPDSVSMILKSKNIPIKSSAELNKEKSGKPIKMFFNGEYVKTFDTLKDGARYLIDIKATKSTDLKGIVVHIRQCANNQRKTAYKRIWQWA